MPECVSTERRGILEAFGAEVILTPAKEKTDGAIRRARETIEKEPGKYYMPDQFSNENNVLAHYETTGPEIWSQTNGNIDVFIAGMEDTLFPSPLSAGNPKELEEERRLFYVAVTRAGKMATLSYALNRYKWGNLERSGPSRFIREMDQKFLDYPQTGGKPFHQAKRIENKPQLFREEPDHYNAPGRFRKLAKKASAPNMMLNHSDTGEFSEGDRVQHERFGIGTITSIEGEPPNTTATVEFEQDGKKKLLLRFAKLEKI
jgi:ATP-dependent exoDNAse (exonuclease V) beta subunit